MLQLGTIGPFGFDDFKPSEILGLYAGIGCKYVQAYRNRARTIAAKEIRQICGDIGLTIDSLHGHFGDDLDPSSTDETTRTYTVGVYEFEADYVRQLGGNMVVVHPSPSYTNWQRSGGGAGGAAGESRGKPAQTGSGAVGESPEQIERRYAALQKSFEELQATGERLGVTFAFENMPPYHPIGADVPRLVNEIARFGGSRIAFLLDTGHAHMTCGIETAVRAAGPHLKYTHVHDNDGVHDTHILPWRGTLPWNDLSTGLKAINYTGQFTLEVFEKAEDLRTLTTADWKRRLQSVLHGEPV